RESSLFSLLLWRSGVSFPFGLVAPLALAGLVAGSRGAVASVRGAPQDREVEAVSSDDRRSGVRLLLLYAASYAASILVFFPTDRYRLPLVPVLALLSGNLLAAVPASLRRPGVIAALLGGLVLFNL